MRKKRDTQDWFDFQLSNLKVTNEHYARYQAISEILDDTPKLLDLVHRDLEAALLKENRERENRGGFVYTSEMVLRLALGQVIERASLREFVVRVDDSHGLRRFTRINDGPMMNFNTLCRLRNAITKETWTKMNQILAGAAVERGQITGERLRLDTTAVETNIHWPTDSWLLWDCYRTLGRLILEAREHNPESVGSGRVHLGRSKRVATRIARKSRHKGRKTKDLKPLYQRLIGHVEGLCGWSMLIVGRLEKDLHRRYPHGVVEYTEKLVEQLRHFEELSRRVIWQTSERVVHGRPVPNAEKLFSIFEPHTELLKRGKVDKEIEFGHMIQIQQTGEKFITGFAVFAKRPFEPPLVRKALESHQKLFGHPPKSVAADKGYWCPDEYDALRGDVETLAIPKKGRRNSAEEEREADPLFKLALTFRAGVEGSISFLKRFLRLRRCMNKGWEQYVSTVGATVLAHNLLILARC